MGDASGRTGVIAEVEGPPIMPGLSGVALGVAVGLSVKADDGMWKAGTCVVVVVGVLVEVCCGCFMPKDSKDGYAWAAVVLWVAVGCMVVIVTAGVGALPLVKVVLLVLVAGLYASGADCCWLVPLGTVLCSSAGRPSG